MSGHSLLLHYGFGADSYNIYLYKNQIFNKMVTVPITLTLNGTYLICKFITIAIYGLSENSASKGSNSHILNFTTFPSFW